MINPRTYAKVAEEIARKIAEADRNVLIVGPVVAADMIASRVSQYIQPRSTTRPFRAPNREQIVGDVKRAKNGVLYLRNLEDFSKGVIEDASNAVGDVEDAARPATRALRSVVLVIASSAPADNDRRNQRLAEYCEQLGIYGTVYLNADGALEGASRVKLEAVDWDRLDADEYERLRGPKGRMHHFETKCHVCGDKGHWGTPYANEAEAIARGESHLSCVNHRCKSNAGDSKPNVTAKLIDPKSSPLNHDNVKIAETIMAQLGTGRLKAMIGAKNWLAVESGLQFDWSAKSKDGSNRLVITLGPNDTYDMHFVKRGRAYKTTMKIRDVYNVDLLRVFESQTGLRTSL